MADPVTTPVTMRPKLPLTKLNMRMRTGFVYSLIAAVFNSGSTLLVSIAVANLLGRDQFGEFAVVQNTLLTITAVATLSTGLTATKFVAEFRSTDPGKASRILGLCASATVVSGLLASGVVFFAASWLAVVVMNAPQLAVPLMIASVAIFLNITIYFLIGILTGLEFYRSIAIAGVVAGTAYLVFCVLGAHFWGRTGALAGIVLSTGVQFGVLALFVRTAVRHHSLEFDFRNMWQERIVIWRFALPATLSGFITMPALWISNMLLVRSADGMGQMAIFAAAYTIRTLLLFLPGVLNSVNVSLINHQKGVRNQQAYKRLYWRNLILTTILVGLGAVAVLLAGPALLSIFGDDFVQGLPSLYLLVLAAVFEAVTLAVYQVIQSREKMWLSFFGVSLPRDISLVLFTLLFVTVMSANSLSLSFAHMLSRLVSLIAASVISVYIGLGITSGTDTEPVAPLGHGNGVNIDPIVDAVSSDSLLPTFGDRVQGR